MIVKFSVANFRSIKKKAGFTLMGEAGQTKAENTFETALPNARHEKLLKSAVIYGANASGKTNFIRALFALVDYVGYSMQISADETIRHYDPFLFDVATEQAPTEFELEFLLPEGEIFIRYSYHLIFNREEVLLEELNYFPKGQSHNLFIRTNERIRKSKAIHTGRLSKSLGYKEIDIFRNQLLLSKFGREIPHELLSNVYLYFNMIEVWNAFNVRSISRLRDEIAKELFRPENAKLLERMNKLFQIADTKIQSIAIREPDNSGESNFDDSCKSRAHHRENVFAQHAVYSNNGKVDLKSLPLSEESAGTNILFALGGVILKRLEYGGVLFFDELDNSLHPKLSRFLVRLFNNPVSNPHNAQLVVATHEVTLLDKEVFRKDQIWFTEKDDQGATDLFSVKDFEGVRDDTPFDKWYMNGKFGGRPKIKEVEFIFGHE